MKRSALQCVAGFIGASLIIAGTVWTCNQLGSPTELKAAQGSLSASSSKKALGKTNKSGVSLTLSKDIQTSQSQSSEPQPRVRQKAGTSLELSYNGSVANADVSDSSTTLSLGTFPDSASPLEDANDANLLVMAETSGTVEEESAQEPLEEAPTVEGLQEFDQQMDQADPFAEVGAVPDPLEQSHEAPFATDSESDSSASDLIEDVKSQSNEVEDAAPVAREQTERQGFQTKPLNTLPSAAPAPSANFRTKPIANGIADEDRQGGTLGDLYSSLNQCLAIPGASELEKTQSAQIIVEKIAPEEAALNRPVSIIIKVKNAGNKAAHKLILRDIVPEGTYFVSSEQKITPNGRNELMWDIFDLEAKEEKTFEYKIVPEQEGPFGSVATVAFAIESTSKTLCTSPKLKVEVSAPSEVEVGQNVEFNITLSNTGTGAATNVQLKEVIPEGLYHPSGAELNNNLGTLNAGESKKLPLTLKAVNAGSIVNNLSVSADDCVDQKIETKLQVTAPQVELTVEGPDRSYIEKNSSYKLSVKNVGDASARDIQLIAQLPENMEFISTDNMGAYKKNDHSVYWDLAELPPQTAGVIELVLKALTPSKSALVFGANGPNNLVVQTSKEIVLDGIAALSFSIDASTDLVEVGKDLEYTIQIVNRGTKASSNVVLQILAPEAMEVIGTDGPTQARNRNGVIVFDKISQIPAKETVTYKIKVSAKAAGDCRIGFQLSSDDLEPLVKEENTRVY